MKLYNDEELKKTQHLESMILRDIVEICNANNLDYWMIYGSALGAVRHQGFIPWDDDIDIGMPRHHYNELLARLERDYIDKYEIGSYEKNSNCPYIVSKIMLRGTTFSKFSYENNGHHMGIFVDIFPYDKVDENALKRKKQKLMAYLFGRLLILKNDALPPITGMQGGKVKTVRRICRIVNFLLRTFHVSSKWLAKKLYLYSTSCNDYPSKYITFVTGGPGFKKLTEENDIYPLKQCTFEGIKVNIPYKNDEILTAIYGDYMKLPPKENRYNHAPDIIDFGNW